MPFSYALINEWAVPLGKTQMPGYTPWVVMHKPEAYTYEDEELKTAEAKGKFMLDEINMKLCVLRFKMVEEFLSDRGWVTLACEKIPKSLSDEPDKLGALQPSFTDLG
ncbi:hypothetical protein RIF29_22647 [Crotalaria pallida]|uniref:Uncharacterized protein n=1 Tax=Crotalaria pallida TaxID=3830 RepID=A0AAN9F4M8_CROPI